ncbi:MAG: LapA family protein [Candidatus Kaiserbacteria bacterium]|nr:LapA family protein [Candidatus Kaiserbacteria bacterium]
MIISLIIGILLGGVSVLFVLQNFAVVTVTFLTWEFSASLALILLATLISGIVITLLVLLPSVIRDGLYVSSLRKRITELENENLRLKQTVPPAQPTQTV